MALDITSGTPLYQQLRQELFARIRRGDFGPSAMLPSESELCREYAVSVTTARRALLELVKEGVVLRRAGVGTMVSPRKRQAHLAFVSIDYEGDAWRENSAAMGELMAGIGELAWRRDASFSMSGVDEDGADEYLRSLVDARSVDGVLIRTPNEVREEHVDILESAGMPYVAIKRELARRALNCVVSDDNKGALLATQHLLEQGHRSIGFVCAKPALTLTQNRLDGYRAALAAAGVAFNPRLVRLESSFAGSEGYRAVRHLLEMPSRPTAIFAASDTMAMGGYQAARSLGLAIPKDVALVGYDDIGPAALLEPPLTTVRTSYHEFGRLATELLLDIIEGRSEPPRRLVIEPQLVVRESTGQAPGRPRPAASPEAGLPALEGTTVLVVGLAHDLVAWVGGVLTDAGGTVVVDRGSPPDAPLERAASIDAAVVTADLRGGLERGILDAEAAADEAARRLARGGRSALVLLAAVPRSSPGGPLATAAVSGMRDLTRALSSASMPHGVRVNALLVDRTDGGRSELEPCLFLLSDAAAALTGQTLEAGGLA